MDYLWIILLFTAFNFLLLFILIIRSLKQDKGQISEQLLQQFRAAREEQSGTLAVALKAHGEMQTVLSEQLAARQNDVLRELSSGLSARQESFKVTVDTQQKRITEAFNSYAQQTSQNLENIRATVEVRLKTLTEGNEKKLDAMREMVDQKLQKTLDEKLRQSFSMVSERLEQVYKGLGEMQNLAVGVGDLKRVLTNVKTRGMLGEVQLKSILDELLTSEQYLENVATRLGSAERVEFCICLPGDGAKHVLLPIDAKFPVEAYTSLVDAYDTSDVALIEAAQKNLEKVIRGFAKDISTRYIEPPHTTDFAVMFLPTESLFAEVVRRGLSQRLQQEYKIMVAGPTTMAALLNSLQMGFRTLAIQKRSSEVWQVLSSVRGEFDNFGKSLTQTQTRLRQAQEELETLVGVRTRKIQLRLRTIEQSLPVSGEDNKISLENVDDIT